MIRLLYKGWKEVKLSPMEQLMKNVKEMLKRITTTLNMIFSVTNPNCLAQHYL